MRKVILYLIDRASLKCTMLTLYLVISLHNASLFSIFFIYPIDVFVLYISGSIISTVQMSQGNVSSNFVIFPWKFLERLNGSEGEILFLLLLTDLSFRRDFTYASPSGTSGQKVSHHKLSGNVVKRLWQ